jgi:hypothetical protein
MRGSLRKRSHELLAYPMESATRATPAVSRAFVPPCIHLVAAANNWTASLGPVGKSHARRLWRVVLRSNGIRMRKKTMNGWSLSSSADNRERTSRTLVKRRIRVTAFGWCIVPLDVQGEVTVSVQLREAVCTGTRLAFQPLRSRRNLRGSSSTSAMIMSVNDHREWAAN